MDPGTEDIEIYTVRELMNSNSVCLDRAGDGSLCTLLLHTSLLQYQVRSNRETNSEKLLRLRVFLINNSLVIESNKK